MLNRPWLSGFCALLTVIWRAASMSSILWLEPGEWSLVMSCSLTDAIRHHIHTACVLPPSACPDNWATQAKRDLEHVLFTDNRRQWRHPHYPLLLHPDLVERGLYETRKLPWHTKWSLGALCEPQQHLLESYLQRSHIKLPGRDNLRQWTLWLTVSSRSQVLHHQPPLVALPPLYMGMNILTTCSHLDCT